MGSEAVYKNQSLLNMLHPEIFPLLNKDCFENDKEVKCFKLNNNKDIFNKIIFISLI